MDPATHIAHLEADAARLLDAYREAPNADVPTCPPWDRAALLHHVGELVCKQPLSLRCFGCEFAIGKDDVFSDSEGARMHIGSGGGSAVPGVDAYAAEAFAEARLHEAAGAFAEDGGPICLASVRVGLGALTSRALQAPRSQQRQHGAVAERIQRPAG